MIPKNAKRVFEGKIFDVYQWEQKMYDGTTKTFEMLDREDAVEIVAVVGDKLTLLSQEQPHRSEPFSCLPGGVVDGGETALACAKRELLEETGYTSDDWELMRAWRPTSRMNYEVSTFIARDCREVAKQNLDAGEKITVHLVSFDEFLEYANDPSTRHLPLKLDLLRARYGPKGRAALKQKLFHRP